MKIICGIILTFSCWCLQYCNAQQINWNTTTRWKLYNIHNKSGFSYPPDSLQFFKNIALDDSLVHNFFIDSMLWPPEKYSLWMGLFVLSYENRDKQVRKIIASAYGGFIYDPGTKRYYELAENKKQAWYQYMNDNSDKLDK